MAWELYTPEEETTSKYTRVLVLGIVIVLIVFAVGGFLA
tara:strand:- start:15527 stop:15643 length:117 start_codon:yes stop_codon:yes gene_type:complete